MDFQNAESFLVHLPSGIHSRMGILLTFITSYNYYHRRVTISTRDTDFFSRDIVSRGYICKYLAKIYLFNNLLHKWNEINVTYFEYRYSLQMFLHILEKSACFDSCVRLAGWLVMSD